MLYLGDPGGGEANAATQSEAASCSYQAASPTPRWGRHVPLLQPQCSHEVRNKCYLGETSMIAPLLQNEAHAFLSTAASALES